MEKLCGNSKQGLGGAAPLSRLSQLSAGSCTCSKLVVVTSSSTERKSLNPKYQPACHWACLNHDLFVFQVQHNKQQQRGKNWGINREVVVLHCGTVGIQLCPPASPGRGKGLGKLAQKPWGQPSHHHSSRVTELKWEKTFKTMEPNL